MDTYASTYTVTSTYSESAAKAVMKCVYDDFICFTIFNLASESTVTKWKRDLLYMMDKEALKHFDLKFSAGSPKGFRYTVSSDGSLTENSSSGGINYFAYPAGTTVNIVVALDEASPNYSEVLRELTLNRGWGSGGIFLNGNPQRDRAYSNANYGVIRESFI
jgi:hypothetical protein